MSSYTSRSLCNSLLLFVVLGAEFPSLQGVTKFLVAQCLDDVTIWVYQSIEYLMSK